MSGADRIRFNSPATATAVTDGGATETVVLTSNGVQSPNAWATISLTGVVTITPGTSATAVVIRVRRGTVTGTLVGVAETDTLAAAANGIIPFFFVDTPGDVDGIKYVVTVVETGAAANGTVNYASIQAFIS